MSHHREDPLTSTAATTPTTTPRAALRELPLGAVRPEGWLLDQLRLQAAGHTGRLAEVWPDVGPDSAWLGGSGEAWERGPYFLDGLVPLAHLLADEELLAQAKTWVEALLASQRPDGQFGPEGDDDWWPRMVACKALTQHADATGDERVVPFLARYAAFQARELPGRPLASWGRVRGADAVLSVLWLHERADEAARVPLADLARLLLEQTADWHAHLTTGLRTAPTARFDHLDHCVNVAMGLKTSGVAAELAGLAGTAAELARTGAELDAVDAHHGLVHGVFSGDEWLAGRDPRRGVETCEVVELMFTLEQLARIHGDGALVDRLELAAFNLLPAACDPQVRSHQYLQQANQVLVSVARREWTYSGDDATVFGLEPNFGCCTANLHQGWPKLVRSLWMATPDGGLAALSYAPCTVEATLGGRPVRLAVTTAYPFEESVRITVESGGGRGALRLRVPGWCERPSVTVGGEPVDATADELGFATVERSWAEGDEVLVHLPMAVGTVPRDGGAVGVRLGPLVLAVAPGETWHPVPGAPGLGEWHVTPRGSWNVGLHLDDDGGPASWPVERRPPAPVPFALDAAPVRVTAPARRIHAWGMDGGSVGDPPASPVVVDTPPESVGLVPYGSARLRLAELPVVRDGVGADRS